MVKVKALSKSCGTDNILNFEKKDFSEKIRGSSDDSSEKYTQKNKTKMSYRNYDYTFRLNHAGLK